MFSKLAFRNVKRQIGNYMIYFITVSLTVALLFAAGNVIFCDNLKRVSVDNPQMKHGLLGVVILISLIVSFVLSYATSFMLRLRKREFGTYLTLGMSRRNILSVFISETMLICIGALGAGLLLGLFLYQGLMAIMMKLLEMEFALASYSPGGLLLTVVLVIGIFLLASLTSAVYLKRVSIYDLIHGDKKVEKAVKYPVLWFVLAAASLAVMTGSFFLFNREMTEYMRDGIPATREAYSVLALAVSIIIFHIGLARSLVYILMRSRKFCNRGTNTFVLRQLSGTLGSNSVMLGFLSFLLAFAVLGANVSFVQKATQEVSLNRTYPYDILYEEPQNYQLTGSRPGEGIPTEQAEASIETYVKIKEKHDYGIYTSKSDEFYRQTKWTGDGYEMLTDSFMKLSDFNALITPLGYEPVSLDREYMVISNATEVNSVQWKAFVYERNGTAYAFCDTPQQYPRFCYVYFYIVIPDQAVEGMEEEIKYTAYDTEDGSYDAQALKKELTYSGTENYMGEIISFKKSNYFLREYARQSENSMNAILVVGALFVAAVFLMLAMAILALKTLSFLESDKRHFEILNRLGAGRREQSHALFRQTLCFFLLPFAMPLLLSIPIMLICQNLMILGRMEELVTRMPVIAAIVALVMALIYLLYYTATYLIARRTVIPMRRV